MAVSIDSLLIVEDDQRLQAGLTKSLSESGMIGVIHACGTVKEARSLLVLHRPDVVLLDVGLPDGSGLDLLTFQHDLDHQTRMIVLSGFSDEQTILSALQLGASGYLLKQDSSANIQQSLANIMRGVPPLSPSVAQCIMQYIRGEGGASEAKGSPPQIQLPPRLHETLKLLARGLTYQDIADQMQISFHTVSSYSQEIYNKLAVRSRGEAVYKAQQMNILK